MEPKLQRENMEDLRPREEENQEWWLYEYDFVDWYFFEYQGNLGWEEAYRIWWRRQPNWWQQDGWWWGGEWWWWWEWH